MCLLRAGVSEEEKAARLAEMMGNSEAHEAGRIERMKRAQDAESGPDTLVKSTGVSSFPLVLIISQSECC